jgi:hypothetical protein
MVAISKKRKVEDGMRGKTQRPTKKVRKQAEYHSDSSESEQDISEGSGFQGVTFEDSEEEGVGQDIVEIPSITKDTALKDESSDSDSSQDSSDLDSSSNPNDTKLRKRNDPAAFSDSISKILSTKLSTSKRSDPVLSRSVAAATAAQSLSSSKLDAKARHALSAQKRAALDNGRVKDVLGVEGGRGIGEILEDEKRLRKIAQRGVVKLFNAVRAAQVKAEEAAVEARKAGLVGQGRKQERATEMSKQGFLDLIAGTGVRGKAAKDMLGKELEEA